MTLKAIGLVFYFELLLLLRRSQEWLYPLGFFILVISLFPLTFTPDAEILQKFIPGYIWLAALFANLLTISTIFRADLEDGHHEQLLLSCHPFTFLILAKLCAHWLVAELPLILLIPLLGGLFNLSLGTLALLCFSLLLGTPILILLNSLCVALTIGLRQQGVLLGLLVFPLSTPVLILGATSVQQFQAGFSVIGPLAFLAGLMIFSVTLLPWVIAATFRMSTQE